MSNERKETNGNSRRVVVEVSVPNSARGRIIGTYALVRSRPKDRLMFPPESD